MSKGGSAVAAMARVVTVAVGVGPGRCVPDWGCGRGGYGGVAGAVGGEASEGSAAGADRGAGA